MGIGILCHDAREPAVGIPAKRHITEDIFHCPFNVHEPSLMQSLLGEVVKLALNDLLVLGA